MTTDKSTWGPKAWRPATDEEYRSLSLAEKIREQMILSEKAGMEAGPQNRAPHLMSDHWRQCRARSVEHAQEAARLRKIKIDQREKFTPPAATEDAFL